MMVQTDVDGVKPLCCPRCGNTGKNDAFNAQTFVLIGEQGLPTGVGDYTEEDGERGAPPLIDCHACDYKGQLDEFHVT